MLDSNKVKKKLSTEDIIKLCCTLQGDDTVYYDSEGHPIFNTCICHGGDSNKLYFYPETNLFHCYTCGDSYDIFELVSRANKVDFLEAYKYVVRFFNIKERKKSPEEEETPLIDDWDIFQRIDDFEKESTPIIKNSAIAENLLEYFYPLAAPEEWIKEGISPEAMRKFGIRVDTALNKIIIPHRDIDGNLIGIRGRSFNPIEVEEGKKYMPVSIENDIYKHPLGKNLYGLYENKETIAKLKKACVFEAEKSVMQIATLYGTDNNFAVATCGSSFSETQADLLLKLGVEEIIIAFDADHVGDRAAQDTMDYEQKLINIAKPYLPYLNVSIIFDFDHILPHKASPSDCGLEKFEQLYHQRIRLNFTQNTDKRK